MTQKVPVIFENGVLRPLKKLRLRERQKLVIRVEFPPTEADSLRETLEILSDQEQLKRIERALQRVRRGKFLSHQQVFGHPQPR